MSENVKTYIRVRGKGFGSDIIFELFCNLEELGVELNDNIKNIILEKYGEDTKIIYHNVFAKLTIHIPKYLLGNVGNKRKSLETKLLGTIPSKFIPISYIQIDCEDKKMIEKVFGNIKLMSKNKIRKLCLM